MERQQNKNKEKNFHFAMLHSKKAQLTIFIIIGVLVVAAAAAFFIVRPGMQESTIETTAEEVPLQAKPVQDFITTCLNEKSKEALVRLGQHGGYIDPTDSELSPKQLKLDPDDPTESDAAYFSYEEESAVPYWWHIKSTHGCANCYVSDENRPDIGAMQEQINKYVEENIQECTAGFEGFEEQGFTIEEGIQIDAQTTIGEDDVSIRLVHPINVTVGGKTTEMTRYFTRLNLELKNIHEFATAVTKLEFDTSFLDDIIIHLISLNSGTDYDRLPPFYGHEESFVPVVWSKSLAKLQIQSLLTSHVPLLRIAGTKDGSPAVMSEDTTIQNLYSPFYIEGMDDEFEGDSEDFEVDFLYLNWPIYLDIRPSEGDTIRPSRTVEIERGIGPFKIPFIFPPLQYYEYYYTASVPVIARIRSYDQFFNETYTFYIAIESNIRDNRNLKDWIEGYGTTGPQVTPILKLKGTPAVEEQLQSDTGLSDENISNIGLVSGNFTKSLFCNPRQRLSGNITIKVIDARNGSEIPDVDIEYACGSYDTCKMGVTSRSESTGDVSLISKFPLCRAGGIISVEKDGYQENLVVGLTTTQDEEQEIEIILQPKITKNITFKKYTLNRTVINDSLLEEQKWLVWNSTITNLTKADMVLLNLRKINDTPWERPFTKFLMFYGDDALNNELFKTVELIPGQYILDIQYFYNNLTTIPQECQHLCDSCNSDQCEKWCREYPDDYKDYCSPGDTVVYEILTAGAAGCITCDCDQDVFLPEEEVEIETSILGGFKTNTTQPWTVTEYDLYETSDQIEFRVVAAPLPRCIQDLSENEEVMKFYETNRPQLLPRFKEAE